LVHSADLLIAEVVAWNVLDWEFDSRKFLTSHLFYIDEYMLLLLSVY